MKIRLWVSAFLLLPLGALLGAGSGQSIPMGALPSTSGLLVSDNFSGSSLSSNWTTLVGSFTVSSGVAGSGDNTATWASTYWNHDTFPANQYSQAVMQCGGAGCYAWAMVAVRMQSTASTYPRAYSCGSSSGSSGVWYHTVYLFREDGTTQTALTSSSTTVNNGDVLRASAVGTTITCSVNGSVVISFTDSTYSSGQPGIITGSATPLGQGLKTWQAGSL